MTHYEQLEAASDKIDALELEILTLHQQLAHERLRADTGWQRYESANADRNSLREQVAKGEQK